MNTISLAPFDKKEWIVQKPNCNQYKIYNSKKRRKGQTGPVNRGSVCMAWDYGDKLIFCYTRYLHTNGKFHTSEKVKYSLQIKNGRLVIYGIQPNNSGGFKVRNSSNNCQMVSANLLPSQVELDEKGKKKGIFQKRLNNVLLNFLSRNGLKGDGKKEFVQNLFYSCFPALVGIELRGYAVSSLYSRYLFEGTIKDVVKKCYGYDSKKLVKTICAKIEKDKSLRSLTLGVPFKKKLPVDYYHELLDDEVEKDVSNNIERIKFSIKKPESLLRQILNYDKKRIVSLLKDINTGEYFRDAMNIFAQRKNEPAFSLPKKPKTWKELHDAIMVNRPNNYLNGRYEPIVTEEANIVFPERAKYKAIDGVMLDEFRFEIPKDSAALIEYSNKMNNCIRWYSQRVLDNTCNLIGVYVGDELKYNISIENNEIQQFYGKYNGQPDPQDKEKIVQFLEEHKICRKAYKVKDVVGNTLIEEYQFTNQELAMEA